MSGTPRADTDRSEGREFGVTVERMAVGPCVHLEGIREMHHSFGQRVEARLESSDAFRVVEVERKARIRQGLDRRQQVVCGSDDFGVGIYFEELGIVDEIAVFVVQGPRILHEKVVYGGDQFRKGLVGPVPMTHRSSGSSRLRRSKMVLLPI